MASDGGPGYEARIFAVTALADPVRRSVYEAVARGREPLSRDRVAAELGLARSTAAFHLERLADAGLLATEFRRLTGRTGPGSGRPSKVYLRADGEVSLSVPRRHYELAGEVMAEAIGRAVADGIPVRDALREAATVAGRRPGRGIRRPRRCTRTRGARADGRRRGHRARHLPLPPPGARESRRRLRSQPRDALRHGRRGRRGSRPGPARSGVGRMLRAHHCGGARGHDPRATHTTHR